MEPRVLPYDTCDLCVADHDVQDEQHAIFHCTNLHTVCLRRRYESLLSEARAQTFSTFFHLSNNKLLFLPNELNVCYEQDSSRTL
jgi:hypothetical protein